jgi:hypothetical protein
VREEVGVREEEQEEGEEGERSEYWSIVKSRIEERDVLDEREEEEDEGDEQDVEGLLKGLGDSRFVEVVREEEDGGIRAIEGLEEGEDSVVEHVGARGVFLSPIVEVVRLIPPRCY